MSYKIWKFILNIIKVVSLGKYFCFGGSPQRVLSNSKRGAYASVKRSFFKGHYFWITLFIFPISATAAENEYSFETGGFVGNILPNQVDGVTEIVPQWGLRVGYPIGSRSFMEWTGTAGKGGGADWSSGSVSFRMDVEVEGFTAITYLGGDVISYEAEGRGKTILGSGHLGGGLMANIGDAIWFRTDMKFNVNPGTSLLISAGFVARLGGDEPVQNQ